MDFADIRKKLDELEKRVNKKVAAMETKPEFIEITEDEYRICRLYFDFMDRGKAARSDKMVMAMNTCKGMVDLVKEEN